MIVRGDVPRRAFCQLPTLKPRFKAARAYAASHRARFAILTEREIRSPLFHNIAFLRPYLGRPEHVGFEEKLIATLMAFEEATTGDRAAASFACEDNRMRALPTLWRLIAQGRNRDRPDETIDDDDPDLGRWRGGCSHVDRPAFLRLTPSSQVRCGSGTYRLKRDIDLDSVLGIDVVATGQTKRLRVHEIEAVVPETAGTNEASATDGAPGRTSGDYTDAQWSEAERRYGFIKPLIDHSLPSKEQIAEGRGARRRIGQYDSIAGAACSRTRSTCRPWCRARMADRSERA